MSTPWIIGFIVLAAAVALTMITVLGTLRRTTAVLLRAEEAIRASTASAPLSSGVEAGTLLPPFELLDRQGKLVPSEGITRKRAILLFVEAHCAPCRRLLAELVEHADQPTDMPVYLIYDESDPKHDIPSSDNVVPLFQANRSVSSAFQTFITPQAFLVEDGRVLAHSLPLTADDLRELSTRTEEVRQRPAQTA